MYRISLPVHTNECLYDDIAAGSLLPVLSLVEKFYVDCCAEYWEERFKA